MKRGIGLNYLLGAVVIIVIVTGCYPADDSAEDQVAAEPKISEANFEDEDTSDAKTPDPALEDLRSQLRSALPSGGISPQTYAEVDEKIRYFEAQGYTDETKELRDMLSQLSIGGQEKSGDTKGIAQKNITEPINESSEGTQKIVLWLYRDGKWKAQGKPPACPEPLVLQSPVDLDLVTSILYPGQVRGGDFKPHGGFRTDDTDGPVEVRAPLDGYVWRAVRFIDDAGMHYMFDIMNECGISYRLGHLGALPPKFQAIVNKLPEPKVDDSRTTEIEPVYVSLGEVIATDTQESTGFDWGVYDLRHENEASQDEDFRIAHQDEPEQAYYAVCWFDYLPADQQAIVKRLPSADGSSGKKSDYC